MIFYIYILTGNENIFTEALLLYCYIMTPGTQSLTCVQWQKDYHYLFLMVYIVFLSLGVLFKAQKVFVMGTFFDCCSSWCDAQNISCMLYCPNLLSQDDILTFWIHCGLIIYNFRKQESHLATLTIHCLKLSPSAHDSST